MELTPEEQREVAVEMHLDAVDQLSVEIRERMEQLEEQLEMLREISKQ